MFADGNRRYLDFSDEVCGLLGYSRTEILSMTIDEISYAKAEVAPLFQSYLREGLQEGDFILRHKLGAPVLIRYRAWVFADGCLAATWQPAEDWEQRYVEALLEVRPNQSQAKVAVAIKAIRERQSALTHRDSLETHHKLRDALSNLKSI